MSTPHDAASSPSRSAATSDAGSSPSLSAAAPRPSRSAASSDVVTADLETVGDRCRRRAWWDTRASRCGDWWGQALELLLPVSCAVCSAPGTALCRGCRLMLRRSTARPAELVAPAPLAAAGVRVWTAGEYEHELASCLLAFKNGGRGDLAPVLSTVLTAVLATAARDLRRQRELTGLDNPGEAGEPGEPSNLSDPGELGAPGDRNDRGGPGGAPMGPVHWVPVPTSARARRRRWFDPVASLLERAGLPAGSHVVHAVTHHGARRAAGSQKTRGSAQRERAIRGTMRGRNAAGLTCVVVDDVLTTGATAAEAVRALREAGADVRGVVTLAAVRVARSPRENA